MSVTYQTRGPSRSVRGLTLRVCPRPRTSAIARIIVLFTHVPPLGLMALLDEGKGTIERDQMVVASDLRPASFEGA